MGVLPYMSIVFSGHKDSRPARRGVLTLVASDAFVLGARTEGQGGRSVVVVVTLDTIESDSHALNSEGWW